MEMIPADADCIGLINFNPLFRSCVVSWNYYDIIPQKHTLFKRVNNHNRGLSIRLARDLPAHEAADDDVLADLSGDRIEQLCHVEAFVADIRLA